MQGEEGALGGYPGSQLCTLGCFLELTAGGEQPRSLGAIWGLSPPSSCTHLPLTLSDCSGLGVGFPFPVQELVPLLCQATSAPHSPKGLCCFGLL